MTIALNGTLSSDIYEELIENLLSLDHSDISEYLSIHQLDISFIAMVLQDTQIPTYYCYSGTTSSPIYVASRIEKQFLMAGIASEVKCLSSKFDLSRKNDDCIRKLKSNYLLVVCPHGVEQLHTQSIQIIATQSIPKCISIHSTNKSTQFDCSSTSEKMLFAINNNKLYCNLSESLRESALYRAQSNGNCISITDITNIRTLIYYMETNNSLLLILQHTIELLVTKYSPTPIEIILIGNMTDALFIYTCQTIRKICSRYKITIKHDFSTDELINHYIETQYLKEIATLWNDADATTNESIINDIYCEFFGEINRGGKLDQETTGINKRNEKEQQSPRSDQQGKKEEKRNTHLESSSGEQQPIETDTNESEENEDNIV